LVIPKNLDSTTSSTSIVTPTELPTGANSFFRQLDHMIASLANEEFATLYGLTRDILLDDEDKDPTIPSHVISMYSDYKAAIFSRYRTVSELLGVALVWEAQKRSANVMLETSGRDVAMFHYVDHFFANNNPKQQQKHPYRKLVLRFEINDLSFAKTSVDARMVQEIRAGMDAVEKSDAFAMVDVNAGGPYGSEVLEGIQIDSDRVWEESIQSGKVGQDWYKAVIRITAHETEPWTAQAVRPDGSLGTQFVFQPL
jgi:hypothetical protein